MLRRCLMGLVLTAPALGLRSEILSISNIPPLTLPTPHRVEVVATNLRVPWAITFLPDGRALFTERPGRVRVLAHGSVLPQPALTLDVALGNKMGLLGLAAHPRFADNHWVYLAWNHRVGSNAFLRVQRYRETNHALVDPVTLFDDIPASRNHTGCRLLFDRDGFLWITTGDADQPPLCQSPDTFHGKILRVTDDGRPAPGNPFPDGPRPEVWSYGHRNPQGLAFHPETGALYASEHGPSGGDELNLIQRGANYGWPVVSHTRTRDDLTPPLAEFTPAVAPGATLFYRGHRFPELKHHLLVACLRGEGLLRVTLNGPRVQAVHRLWHRTLGRIREIAECPQGFLYLTTSQHDPREGVPREHSDLLVRVVPASEPARYPAFTPPPPPPVDPPQGRLASIILQQCAACHGPTLAGGAYPSLVDGLWVHARNDDDLRRILVQGLPDRGMPPPTPPLKPDDLESIIRYLREREPRP